MKNDTRPSAWLSICLHSVAGLLLGLIAVLCHRHGLIVSAVALGFMSVLNAVAILVLALYDARCEPFRRAVLMEIGDALWWLSERTCIGLGRFAPTVLGWKLGVKAVRVQ
jgi:uncharacterized membrane protein